MKLTIDLSQHNYLAPATWDRLAPVLDGVIIRLSYGVTRDIAAADLIAEAMRVGLPYAGYHWSDPTWDFNRQLSVALGAIRDHKPASWFSDCEQWWSDWVAWARNDFAALAKSKIPADKLNNFYKSFAAAVDAQVDIPIGNYSADWFIDNYSPQMGTWIKTQNYWEARYAHYYDRDWWANFQANNPVIDSAKLHEAAQLIFIPKGVGRQWESFVAGASGFPTHLDHNVFNPYEFPRLFSAPIKQDEIPPIPEPEISNYSCLEDVWVRDVPNGLDKIGYRWKGNLVTVIDKSMGWMLVDAVNQAGGAKGWVAGVYLAPAATMFKVTAVSLWIRDVPSGNKIGYLLYGAQVQRDRIGMDGWWHIVAGNGKPAGWVQSAYLKAGVTCLIG